MSTVTDLTNFDPDSNFTWEDYVKLSNKITSIDQSNLTDVLSTHSAVYSYYAGVMNWIKRNLDVAESTLEKMEADLRSAYYKEYKADNKTKPTDKMSEMHVISNNDYQSLKRQVIDLEYKYNLFKSLGHAMEHRKDMLVQLSSNRRHETKLYS